jgi:pimeloyl-ACP methyl ester carboxylesterase
MAESIYRSPAGETELRALYQEARAALGSECESHFVPTRYGATHVLVTGPAAGPPAVVFHGGNFVGPYSLQWMLPALAGYRVYAPDTVGHPGLSAQTRLSPRDQSYGRWAAAVLDGLGLDQVSTIGTSSGAAILLRLAELSPDRIERAVLHVPAGMAQAPLWQIIRIALPMLLYRWRPCGADLQRIVNPLCSEPLDDLGLRILGAVLRTVKLETGLPRLAGQAELARFTAPTLVVAGERDPLFPADRVLARAREVIPNLTATERLAGRHFPSRADVARLQMLIDRFFDRTRRGPPSA